jgi:hypothetical protein
MMPLRKSPKGVMIQIAALSLASVAADCGNAHDRSIIVR